MKVSHAAQTTATAVLGSFVFGYVLAGVNAIENIIAWDLRWCAPDTIYCDAHLRFGGLVAGSFFVGSAVGALIAGWQTKYGRRRTLLLADAVVCCACLVGVACPQNVAPTISFGVLFSARLLCGVGCGIHLVLIPLYILEWAPDRRQRGHLCFHQVLVAFGLFMAAASGYVLDSPPLPSLDGSSTRWKPENEAFDRFWWRAMLALPMAPCLVQALILQTVLRDETPMHYLCEGKLENARKSVEKVHSLLDVDAAFTALCQKHEPIVRLSALTSPCYRYVLGVGISFALFQQFVGFCFAVTQSNALFMECGLTGREAQLASVGMMFVHFAFTCTVVRFVSTAGRRVTLLRSFGGMAISMGGACALSYCRSLAWASPLSVVCTALFLCFFAFGVGPLTWVVVAEFFPLAIRSYAMAMAVSANQCVAFLVVLTCSLYPKPFVLYGVFTLLNILGFFFVRKFFTNDRRLPSLATMVSTEFDSDVDK